MAGGLPEKATAEWKGNVLVDGQQGARIPGRESSKAAQLENPSQNSFFFIFYFFSPVNTPGSAPPCPPEYLLL
ncbi:hypothetical protein O9929_14485 [Vibrio lentus]|nr:hypothetical protein [Vibrio lentus]